MNDSWLMVLEFEDGTKAEQRISSLIDFTPAFWEMRARFQDNGDVVKVTLS